LKNQSSTTQYNHSKITTSLFPLPGKLISATSKLSLHQNIITTDTI